LISDIPRERYSRCLSKRGLNLFSLLQRPTALALII
jgi:hypothetical protein